jgi:hypothetical protein
MSSVGNSHATPPFVIVRVSVSWINIANPNTQTTTAPENEHSVLYKGQFGLDSDLVHKFKTEEITHFLIIYS